MYTNSVSIGRYTNSACYDWNTNIQYFQDSFVSAQDTIADLRDFEDLNEIVGDTDAAQKLYLEALEHLEKNGIPYRTIRTDFVGCANDTEYLAKLHCLRLAFKDIMAKPDDRNW